MHINNKLAKSSSFEQILSQKLPSRITIGDPTSLVIIPIKIRIYHTQVPYKLRKTSKPIPQRNIKMTYQPVQTIATPS